MEKRGNKGSKDYSKTDLLNKKDVIIIDLPVPPPSKNKKLYTKQMKLLAQKTNQDFYTRFKLEHNIDFMPVYVEYDTRTKSHKLQIRTDWMMEELKADKDFVTYLRSNEAIGIKHRFIHAKEYEHYITHKTEYHEKPHWIKNAWKPWADKYFRREFNFKNQGVHLMSSDYGEVPMERTGKSGNLIEKYKQQFTHPIQGKDLKNLFDPDNKQFLIGDRNTQSYLASHEVNQKKYNFIMEKVLGVMWEEFQKVDVNKLTGDSVDDYTSSFHARFPNIVRIRDWFVNKGIYNTDGQHQFTTENFMKLKSNTARSNFIDRASFVISNAIYMKNNNIKSTFASGKPIKSAGLKMPISQARRYKKQSKTREKYHTERRNNYELWKLDNRKLAANLKRKTTRKDNRLKR